MSYYSENYTQAHRQGIQGIGNSLVDLAVERFARRRPNAEILEIGASSGEQFKFVKQDPTISTYVALDLLPGVSNPDLAKSLRRSGGLVFTAADAAQLPFPDATFDLVVSTCVWAHVVKPECVLRELRRVTKKSGRIVLCMPCDPGVVNCLAKVLITYRQMRKAGIKEPKLSYAREHINPIHNLIELTRHVFASDKLKMHYFPFNVPSWNLNLLVAAEIIRTDSNRVS